MAKEMIISVNGREKKIAIIENDQVTEFYIERGEGEQGIVGNIYKGRVMRVLPGMQSAFVDIGLERDAFLYVSDFFDEEEEFERIVIDQPKIATTAAATTMPATTAVAPPRSRGGRRDAPIEPALIATPPDEATEQTRTQAATRPTVDARGQREDGQRDKPRRNERSDRGGRGDRSGRGDRDKQRQPQFAEPTDGAKVAPLFDDTADSRGTKGDSLTGQTITPAQSFDAFGADDTAATPFVAGDNDFERIVDEEARAHEGEMFKDARLQERLSDQARAIEFEIDTAETETPFASSLGTAASARSSFERIGDDEDAEEAAGAAVKQSPTANIQTQVAASIRQFSDEVAAEDASSKFTSETTNFERVSDDEDNRPSFAATQPVTEASPQERQKRGGKERVKKQRGGKQSAARDHADAGGNSADAEQSDNVAQTQTSTDTASTKQKPKAKRGATSTAADTDTASETAASPSSSTRSRRSTASTKQASKSRKNVTGAVEESGTTTSADSSSSANSSSLADAPARRSRSRKGKGGDAAPVKADGDSDSFVAEDSFDDAEASINVRLARGEFARRRRRRGGAGRDEPNDKNDQETTDMPDEKTAEENTDEPFGVEPDRDFGDLREAFAEHLEDEEDDDQPETFPVMPTAPDALIDTPVATQPVLAAVSGQVDVDGSASGNNGGSTGNNPRAGNQRESSQREGNQRERAGARRGANGGGGRNDRGGGRSHPPAPVITDLLREGQEILVQIAKEPISQKGARITSHIALPGRFLVYMPTIEHVGVSRKIESDSERIRLRRLIKAIREEEDVPSGGFIVRTAGVGIIEEELREDARYLVRLWRDMRRAAEKQKAPTIVHQDLDLIQRLLRDQLSDDFTAIRVDSEEEYQRIVEFINLIQPRMVNRVKLYTREGSILQHYGVQAEIEKAIKPRVWLRSGGYLVINQTEALVAIDVNTGKFVGRGGNRLEDTITKTNLEAVDEIARQIRLRDLGGIIVLDLIDMEDRRNRNRVLQALHDALEQDKSPNKVLSFNDFGLVIMTRKRVKQSLERTLCVPCVQCQGSGMVKSPQTICYEVLEQARTLAREMGDDSFKQVTLRVNTEVARALRSTERDVLAEIEDHLGATDVNSDEHIHPEQFDFAFV